MNNETVIERIRGSRIETGAHRPFIIDDPARVYFVEQGHLDIFVAELDAGLVAGRRYFVARIGAGEMAFGIKRLTTPGHNFGLFAVPSLNAVLIQGERDGVASTTFDIHTINWIDEWISNLSGFLAHDRPPPKDILLLEADPEVPYPAGAALSAQHNDIIWVGANHSMRLLGRHDLDIGTHEPLLPLTERTWCELDTDTRVSAVYTPAALMTNRFWNGFERFGALVIEFAMLAEMEAVDALQTQRHSALEARRASVSGALRRFSRILGGKDEAHTIEKNGHSALQLAARLVASSCGATLEIPERFKEADTPMETIKSLARRSGIKTREITLAPHWWRRAGPSFVSFRVDENGKRKPLALISDQRGGYRAQDPDTNTTFPVNAETAPVILTTGVMFYPPLPARIKSTATILGFAMHERWKDVRTLLSMGILGGLVSLLTPILTGQILAGFIPRAEVSLWVAALGALLLAALGAAVFEIVQGLSLLRIESRVDERLQSAIWSRLVSLPIPFFRDFTAGDLANRANGISDIRQLLTGAATQTALGVIFSVFSLALLFYYSWMLALCVSILLSVLVGIIWIVSIGQLRHFREVFHIQGALNGFIFQMISGLAKLRVAHGESYALAHWARRYSEQKQANLAALRWAAGQHVVIDGMFQPLVMLVVFAFVNYALQQTGETLELADFLSFNVALGQLTWTVLQVSGALPTALSALPLFERVKPILDAQPEVTADGIDLGAIKGELEFANVTFRYEGGTTNAIDNMSFHVRQGDYVAFVGPSGCGKSTIYRLLLGFERPTAGTIFLDGRDISSLNLTEMRRRMGVVLQNGKIMAGSIYENIAGMSPLSLDEAWTAVRAAALEDDIRAMPMGMRTALPEDGVGLSVGQKQRLLIARALVRKPRILLFDEATSALDNRAQSIVQSSLKKLSVTRVVIAHRLSSIRAVEKIYVIKDGRIVESGSYDELMERDGVFTALSRRQLAQS